MTKKQPCIDCKKETTNGVFILTGKNWIYEYYCINCARAFLGKFAPMSLLKATQQELNMLSGQYDMILQKNRQAILNAGFSNDEVPMEFKKNLMERSA